MQITAGLPLDDLNKIPKAIAAVEAAGYDGITTLSWDLQKASRGRFVLGLGSQVKGHNERRFSVPWTAPAPRMRECVQAIRAIFQCWASDATLNYEGDHYRFTLMPPNFKPEPLDGPPPPITIAAVGPAMIKVAGQECDGVRLHPFCTRAYLENVALPRLTGAMASRARARSNFEITGGGLVAWSIPLTWVHR